VVRRVGVSVAAAGSLTNCQPEGLCGFGFAHRLRTHVGRINYRFSR
jgi:hypothetical protein